MYNKTVNSIINHQNLLFMKTATIIILISLAVVALVCSVVIAASLTEKNLAEKFFGFMHKNDTFKAYVLAKLENGFFVIRKSGDFALLELRSGEKAEIGRKVSVKEIYRLGVNGKDVFPAIERPKCYVLAQTPTKLQAQLVTRLGERFVLCNLQGEYIFVACTPKEQTEFQISTPIASVVVNISSGKEVKKTVNVLMLPICDDGSVLPIRKYWLA